MKKKIAALLTAGGLCLSLFAGVLPTSQAFSDVPDGELAEAVSVLNSMGIVSGYTDGGFHPDDGLSRAQFCKLIIAAQGKEDQVVSGSYKSLFDDLPASHWAVGYINLACDQGLLSGYGNGCFGPDDPVTLAQAVTVVLRVLGYTNKEIGPFWPEDYLNKAQSLGLTEQGSGLGDQPMTRGEAAQLLYAMLQCKNTAGKTYYQTLAATVLESVILMDQNAEGPDGTLGMAQVYNGKEVTYYEQEYPLSEEMNGRRGTLLLNQSGKVMGMLPDDKTYRQVELKEAQAKKLVSVSGEEYSIASNTPVVFKGEKVTWQEVWYQLGNYASAQLYETTSGSVELIFVGTANAKDEEAVVVTVSDGAESFLRKRFNLSGTVSVRKNGVAASFSDICQYDVATYDAASRTLQVSSRALVGSYENAVPGTSDPDQLQVAGVTMEVLECAWDSLAEVSVGEKITVLRTVDGAVAAVYPAKQLSKENIGIYDGQSVTLWDGTQLSGTISNGENLIGSVVRVYSSGLGTMNLSRAEGTAVKGALKVSERTLGKLELACDVVLYDMVGGASAVQLTLDDLMVDTLSAGKISSVYLDDNGRVSLILLNDATGDCYTYGMLSEREGDYTDMVAVENGTSRGSYYNTTSLTARSKWSGLAVGSTGKAAVVCSLTKATVSRKDIDLTGERETVTLKTGVFPISPAAQVYNEQTDRWMSLTEALAFAEEFTVYYDRPVSENGQIRMLCIEAD